MEDPKERRSSKQGWEDENPFTKFTCLDIHDKVPYWSEELDERGYGVRMFQRYSREEDDPVTETFIQVKKKVAHFLDEASAELTSSSDEEQKMLALGRLYAALHYETEVRRWAARSRQVFQDEPSKEDEKTSDFEEFRDHFKNPAWVKLGYWARPVVVFFFCFAAQSFMLHLATRAYIRYMDTAEKLMEAHNATLTELEGIGEHDIASLFAAQLPDFVTSFFTSLSFFDNGVPVWLLDLSGALPAFLFLVTYVFVHARGGANIGLWTKTFIVACLMALMKGSIDLITIIPDSAGWQNCQARLGDEDLKSLRSLDFCADFFKAMAGAIYYEIMGGAKGRMRYCADMLISGHTYFAVLFSLSSYSMIRYVTTKRRGIRFIFFVVFSLCILTEIFLVAGAQFHYAVDMVLSIILVLTLWDSVHIETLASKLTLGYEWCNEPAGLKAFCIGGGYGHKELWTVTSEDNDAWRKSWKRNGKWVSACPQFYIFSPAKRDGYYLKRRGDDFYMGRGREPPREWYPVKVCATVEPWKSTKLIDIAYCQNTVLEDPDGPPQPSQNAVLADPDAAVQSSSAQDSEPNNRGSNPTDRLVTSPGGV